ncbi:cytochrome b [Alteromonadaceae bacterium M269]|nr:cytochrome b [Alteromonadaceae bacterium M269]
MGLKNNSERYGWLSIALHWIMALAVFGLFGLGYWMVDLDYYSEWYRRAPSLHKSIGITLIALWIFRVFWRVIQQSPKSLDTHKPWERKVSKLTHLLLYVLMLTIMISGYLISTADGRGIEVFNLFTLPSLGELVTNQEDVAGEIHEVLAYIILGVAILHALAALKHHFIDKDQTLIRILRR